MTKLRIVKPSSDRPLVPLTMAEKRANAIAWLRARNLYVLDQGSKPPKWSHGKHPAESA